MATLEAQLEPTLGRWGRELRNGRALTIPVRGTVADIKGEQLRLLALATGSDLRLSNFPRRGRPERADIETVVKRNRGELRLTPPGLWGLVASGARPHAIGRPRQVLRIAGRFVTGPISHPGTTKTRNVEADRRFMDDSWNAEVRQDLRRRRIS